MANAQILEQKKQIVADLAEKIKNSAAGVVVDYKGITVEDDTKLRSDLRKAGVEYMVVKNTLTSKACDIVGFENIKKVLEGMTAIAISEKDPVAAAKIIDEFASKHDNYQIKAGFVEGKELNVDEVKELAKTPGFEALIAKMLGSLQSSLYNLAYALQAIVDKNGGSAPAEEAAPAAE